MDGQLSDQVQAWGSTASFHYTFAPHWDTVAQISISSRYDYNDWAVPVSRAMAVWTSRTTTGSGASGFGLNTSSFRAIELTEAEGLLIADNCYVEAIVNFFFWPLSIVVQVGSDAS